MANSKKQKPVGEVNRTDPKVCHDPTIKLEGIARTFENQNKENMVNGELSNANTYDTTYVDGIEYPLIAINNRNIEVNEIIYMNIDYTQFLPKIYLKVYDTRQNEQRISSTQMSSIIRVIMISPIDKVYKKILLNFRILNVYVDKTDPSITSYSGEYYVEGFRNVNTTHIWMPKVCNKSAMCGQGGHVNANTWEMLHQISTLTGLGFAATKKCKEVPDHLIRTIYTQRYNNYIEKQLQFSGTDIENIFDAWVDLYGYIVMVNVPWVLSEDVKHDEITINANVGLHPNSNDLDPNMEGTVEVERTLTNYIPTGVVSNMEIESYNMVINNESIIDGTLERIYPISMTYNGRFTKIEPIDIQTKQNSIDGEYIEEYNTGKSLPIPKFDFNSDEWTGLIGGYNVNTQKRIRLAYFKKIRQSVLYVRLKTFNLGLQRGTLVNIVIAEDDAFNKDFEMKNTSRISGNTNIEEDKVQISPELDITDVMMESDICTINLKLSDIYYIDGMTFEYDTSVGKIVQTLKLIKRGVTSGYANKHTIVGMPLFEHHETLKQTDSKYIEQTV